MQSAESHLEFTFKMKYIYTTHLNLSYNEFQRSSNADRLYIKL